jgi:hypothetical protein
LDGPEGHVSHGGGLVEGEVVAPVVSSTIGRGDGPQEELAGPGVLTVERGEELVVVGRWTPPGRRDVLTPVAEQFPYPGGQLGSAQNHQHGGGPVDVDRWVVAGHSAASSVEGGRRRRE